MFFGTLPDDPDGIIDRAELSTSWNAAALTIVWYGDGEFEVVIEGNSNARVLRVELSGPMKGTEQFACSAAGAHVFVNQSVQRFSAVLTVRIPSGYTVDVSRSVRGPPVRSV